MSPPNTTEWTVSVDNKDTSYTSYENLILTGVFVFLIVIAFALVRVIASRSKSSKVPTLPSGNISNI
jgi:hypothetical protein